MISKLSIYRRNSGFTLTELMIAAFISIIVVAFGGWSVAAIISSSKTNESQNERRGELNRALDFMAAEIRESVNINSDISSSAPEEFTSSLNDSSEEIDKVAVKEILRLQIPGLSEPVIYYNAPTTMANKTWRGPNIIYRWGPPFDGEGHYDAEAKLKLSSWVHAPLIDALENTDSDDCSKDPKDPKDTWKRSPESGATGLYACIDPSHKIAQLHSVGRINKVLDAKDRYPANSQAFARTAVLPVLPVLPALTALPAGSRGGEITLPVDATMKMEILGSAVQCGSGASLMKTQLVINKVKDAQKDSLTLPVDPTALPSIAPYERQPAGTSFNFTGSIPPKSENPNNCEYIETYGPGPVNSLDNTIQVKILRDGDTVPEVAGFDGTDSAQKILSKHNLLEGTTINVEPNQYLILFELGVKDNTKNPAFDLQDLVVRATVDPV